MFGDVDDSSRCLSVDSIAHVLNSETDGIQEENSDVYLLRDNRLFQSCNNWNVI